MRTFGSEMIGGHELERLASDDARVADRAAEIEHLRKPRIVVHRRQEPAAAGFKTRRRSHVDELRPACPLSGSTGNGSAMRARLSAGTKKSVSLMPSGFKNSLMEKRAQGLPGDDLDDAADHIGGMAVIPRRARLVDQRQLGQFDDEFGGGEIARQGTVWRWRDRRQTSSPRYKGAARRIAGERVCQPGCVAQQILNGDGPLGRDQFELAVAFHADLHVG